MLDLVKISLWQQFGASIALLENNIESCPDAQWQASLWLTPTNDPEFSQFWYVAYHTLFWLDLYLTGTEDGFLPPPQFTLIEQYDFGPLPERVYTKAELLAYLNDCRDRCRATIAALTEETAQQHCQFGWGECSFLGLMIYNLRHVQGHATQMNMLLGQQVGPQLSWVARDSSH